MENQSSAVILKLKVLSLHNNLLERVERKFASTCIILIQVIPKLPLVLIFVWLDAVQSSRGWALAKYWCSTGITQCALPRALPNLICLPQMNLNIDIKKPYHHNNNKKASVLTNHESTKISKKFVKRKECWNNTA